MRFFSLILLTVVLFSCTGTGSRKPSSEWDLLESAEKVSCESFPKPESAIALKELTLLHGKNTAFVAEYAMRNGANGRFLAGFKGDEELKPEELEPRVFGEKSLVVGGVTVRGRMYVAVIQALGKSAKLELRSLDGNVVQFVANLPTQDIKKPALKQSKKSMWLTYAEVNDDVSVEDANIGVMQFSLPKGRNDKSLKLVAHHPGQPNGSYLIPIEEEQTEALVVWGQKTASDAKSFKFFMKGLGKDSAQKPVVREIEMPVDAGIESWSAQEAKQGFYLSTVDGDSMVGQANLKAARVYWQDGYQKVGRVKTRSLLNEHVSEPSWIKAGGRQYLVLPKWLDNESTLGVYTVSDTDIENAKAVGIFPDSLRLMSLFKDDAQEELFSVVRYKAKQGNVFEICNLKAP